MKRDPSIELYRIFLMFGIMVLHAAYASCEAFHWLNTGLAWCVDGFVFITGYFGCRFDWRKIIRLYATAVWCGLIVVAGWWLFACTGVVSKHWLDVVGFGDIVYWGVYGFVHECALTLNAWFLNAYVLMLCLVPLVNFVVDNVHEKRGLKLLIPLLVAAFGWGLVIELPILHRWVPRIDGVGSFTGMTLLGVYVCGRVFRCYESRIQVRTLPLLIALIVLLIIDTAGYGWLGHYASPFAVATAIVVFLLFKRVKVSGRWAAFVLFVSPSMFSVYLLQGFRARFDLLNWLVRQMPDLWLPVACIVASLVLFPVCVLIDLPRRAVVWLVRKRMRT